MKATFKTRNAAGGRYRVTWTIRKNVQRAIVPSLAVAKAMRAAHANGDDPWTALAVACGAPEDAPAAARVVPMDAGPDWKSAPWAQSQADAMRVMAILQAIEDGTVTADEAFSPIEKTIAQRKDPDYSQWSKGGRTRAANLTPERRREIAQAAGRARWQKRQEAAAANGSPS